MSKTRYKIKKAQLERVVESFVTESASPEAKKHIQGYNDKEDESLGMKDGKKSTKKVSEKGRRADSKGKWGSRLKHAAEAKKHKMSMGAEQSNDMGQGMKKASESSSSKMKQAPEAKKHVKGSVSEAKKKQIIKLLESGDVSETELQEFFGMGTRMRREKIEKNLRERAYVWAKKGVISKPTQQELDEVMKKAEDDDFEGQISAKDGKIYYKTEKEFVDGGGRYKGSGNPQGGVFAG